MAHSVSDTRASARGSFVGIKRRVLEPAQPPFRRLYVTRRSSDDDRLEGTTPRSSCYWSSKAFASFKSCVSKPPVNQA
jgi:hypothetical protein